MRSLDELGRGAHHRLAALLGSGQGGQGEEVMSPGLHSGLRTSVTLLIWTAWMESVSLSYSSPWLSLHPPLASSGTAVSTWLPQPLVPCPRWPSCVQRKPWRGEVAGKAPHQAQLAVKALKLGWKG